MNEETLNTLPEARTRQVPRIPAVLVQFAIPYSIIIAVLYLLGYWRTFQVNPLEYVGVSDFLRLAAYPLALLMILSTFWFLLHEAHSAMARSLMRWASGRPWRLLVVAYASLAVLVAIGLGLWFLPHEHEGPDTAWVFALSAGFLVSLIAALELGSSDAFQWISRFAIARKLIVLAVLIPLTSSFSFGRIVGKLNLRDGCAAVEVDLARSGIALDNARGATYLGNLGGHVFMREWDTGAIVITQLANSEPLVLLPRDTASSDRRRACKERRGLEADPREESMRQDSTESGTFAPSERIRIAPRSGQTSSTSPD